MGITSFLVTAHLIREKVTFQNRVNNMAQSLEMHSRITILLIAAVDLEWYHVEILSPSYPFRFRIFSLLLLIFRVIFFAHEHAYSLHILLNPVNVIHLGSLTTHVTVLCAPHAWSHSSILSSYAVSCKSLTDGKALLTQKVKQLHEHCEIKSFDSVNKWILEIFLLFQLSPQYTYLPSVANAPQKKSDFVYCGSSWLNTVLLHFQLFSQIRISSSRWPP